MKNDKLNNYFYKITNLINGKFYYGIHSTDNLDDRYFGSSKILKRAVKKYGKENFIKEIIANYLTRKEASDHEARVVTMELVLDENCYNARTGGENESTVPFLTQIHKDRIGLRHKGKIVSEETRERIRESKKHSKSPMEGKNHSIESKIKISIASKEKFNKNPLLRNRPFYFNREDLEKAIQNRRSYEDDGNPNSTSVLDPETGIIYKSKKSLYQMLGISKRRLNTQIKNGKFVELGKTNGL